MIGYPLDSHVTYGADGTPIWDRAVSSAALRKLTKKLFSDGVLPNPSTNLQVAAVSGIIVKISSGFALCNGCQKLQEVDLEIELPVSDATYDRIDTVVLRLDDNDDVRACDFMVIKGIAASTPQIPALTQSDSIWEIGLANIYRKANSTEVSNANITDTRYDTSRCGIISSISQFDTKTLYQQIEADLDEFKTVNQAEFLAWFETIQNQLSEDIAGNLLTMINDIKEDIGSLEDLKTKTQTSIVDAINELKNGLDNAKVDTLTTMEEVNASTDKTKPVGAGAIQELNSNLENVTESLVAEDNLKFRFSTDGEGNYGYLGADDSFIPFKKSKSSIAKVYTFTSVDNTNSMPTQTYVCPDDGMFIFSYGLSDQGNGGNIKFTLNGVSVGALQNHGLTLWGSNIYSLDGLYIVEVKKNDIVSFCASTNSNDGHRNIFCTAYFIS